MLYGYITPYLEEVVGLDALGASTVLMAYGVMCFFSNLISGWADARFGLRALMASFPVQAAMLALIWLLGSATAPAIAVILALALTMYIVSVPCISVFMKAARRWHPKALTLASSLEPTAFNTGIAFGTAMGGAVVGSTGLAQVGLVGAAFSLVAWALTGVTFVLDRRRSTRG